MRITHEIDCDGPQSTLLETKEYAPAEFVARLIHDDVVVYVRGQ